MTKEEKKPLFSGKVAFTLYDTYGFPLDLTQMLLRERGIELNIDEFNEAMKEQKERSKVNWVGSGDAKQNELYLQIEDKTNFLGYEEKVCNGTILKLIKNNQFVDKVENGDEIEIITDNTVFYGECGGQVGDSGLIMKLSQDGNIPMPFSIIQINNTIKTGKGTIIHKGKVESGSFAIGDLVSLNYDREKRCNTRKNHSATHLLHYALKQILGNNVNQKGSYVDNKRLRFDFSYNKQITKEELKQVENIVNNLICQNSFVKTEIMNIDDAKNTGAMALFGEKYGETVRVVSMGTKETVNKELKIENSNNITDITSSLQDMLKKQKKEACSIELCGGTHVVQTGDIGLFKIIKEESIASGIRRIEAITGIEALNYVNNQIDIVNKLSECLKANDGEILGKIENLINENKTLKKQIENNEKAKLNDIVFDKQEKNGIVFNTKILENANPNDVKCNLVNWLNNKFKENNVVIIICKNGEKNTILVGISKNITDKYNANDILKKLEARGGGQPHFAMGSIKNAEININRLF